MLASFRSYPVGLTLEIEKAFLMVSIKEDRNTFRFLWFDNPDWDRPKIAQFRFNRLLFGLWPSPLVLGGTIAHHLSLYKQSELDMAVLLEKNHWTLMIYFLEQETMGRPWKFITNRRGSWGMEDSISENGTLILPMWCLRFQGLKGCKHDELFSRKEFAAGIVNWCWGLGKKMLRGYHHINYTEM